MAFKLTKDEAKTLNEIIERLRNAASTIEDALSHYNEALQDAREFCRDVEGRADDEIGEKSEKWQEGDKGTEAADWRDAWSNVELDEVEIDLDHATTLEELPEAAGE